MNRKAVRLQKTLRTAENIRNCRKEEQNERTA